MDAISSQLGAVAGAVAYGILPSTGATAAPGQSSGTRSVERGERPREAEAVRIYERTVALGADYAALRARQDALNQQAQQLRSEQDAGKEPDLPRKLFPPYPPEQEARMAYLEGLAGFRALLDRVATPQGQAGVEAQALALSRVGNRQLAEISQAGFSMTHNRAALERVVQNDPLQ
jgi:hypothetical protein